MGEISQGLPLLAWTRQWLHACGSCTTITEDSVPTTNTLAREESQQALVQGRPA